ncbi:MAG TPA: Gfo/Idh/MocA family oxidoreductase [Rhodopila sp.]|uniref:Gfo/Idh/MocA family protein n=1 Tax=Rhodopila sp. TaxID=2480087 RepID=UPI002C0A4AAB|nr:Gfo/Idh/MocA family oxidoreductase [Rhodopila sp.]HVY16200.1 Gfo/Idh/MocA family oxidoreductase [Rhodopila sp.]
MTRFAAIGLDHRHVYDLTAGLLAAGAVCAGHDPVTTDPRVLAGFRKRFPDVPAVDRDALLGDPSIDFIVLAAVPRDRAGIAIEAMRRGKHVMTDKPGVTTADQLTQVEQAARDTGRIWSVVVGRLTSPAVQEALHVARSGELGRLVSLTSLAPHRLNRALRPSWFFDRAAYGGIIADIGLHSIDQFMAFAGTDAPGVAACSIGRFGTEPKGFEDFAEITLRGGGMTGTMRLDWFTPDGLPDWGDGRLFLVGTEGTLELRKNLDLMGRSGGDHMFVANRRETYYRDCAGLPVTYYSDFLADVRDHRTQSDARVTEGGRVFAACRMALRCQAEAAVFGPGQVPPGQMPL